MRTFSSAPHCFRIQYRGAAFDLALAQGALLVSIQSIAELDQVLHRPKFDKYVSESQRLEFLTALLRTAEQIDVKHIITECRDSKDNKFLELALSGHATHIVSGDADLLVLNPFRGIPILNPQAFVEFAESQRSGSASSDPPDADPAHETT